jgi:hypothetical protein
MNILYCLKFWDSPSLECQVPVCISHRNRIVLLYPQALGFPVEVEAEVKLRPTVRSQSVLVSGSHLELITSYLFLSDSCGFLVWRHSLSLKRGWVCNLLAELLLGHARAVSLGFKSRRTQDHILLPHLRPSQPGGLSPRIYIRQERVAQLYSRALGSLFVASYYSQGYGGGIVTHLRTGHWTLLMGFSCQSQSYITTDGQSTSLSWCQAPI